MIYDRLKFPVFPVHTDEVLLADGILWIENQVLDDTNMKGKTLGMRRLQSPMNSMYPIKYMLKETLAHIMYILLTLGVWVVKVKLQYWR